MLIKSRLHCIDLIAYHCKYMLAIIPCQTAGPNWLKPLGTPWVTYVKQYLKMFENPWAIPSTNIILYSFSKMLNKIYEKKRTQMLQCCSVVVIMHEQKSEINICFYSLYK